MTKLAIATLFVSAITCRKQLVGAVAVLAVGGEEVRLVEVDRVDVGEIDEVGDLDRARRSRGDRGQLLGGEDHVLTAAEVVPLHDVAVGDLLAAVSHPTRLFRIRSEVPARNWLKWIERSSVAEYRPTGTLTRPKLSDPVQIALAIVVPPCGKKTRIPGSLPRRYTTGSPSSLRAGGWSVVWRPRRRAGEGPLKIWLPNVDCYHPVRGIRGSRRRDTDISRARRDESFPIVPWVIYGVVCFALAGYLLSLLLRGAEVYWIWLDGWVVCGIEVAASGLCIAKGLIGEPGRRAALILGFALLSWAFGDVMLTAESVGGATPPSPSLADLFYLGFYPLAYVAVVMIMRGEVRKVAATSWLDGAIAGFGAAAVCAAFAFHDILSTAGTSVAATATNLAYPIGDLLLLGLVVGSSAMLSGRPKMPWIFLASGLALNVVGDTSNLLQHSLGASRFGTVFNGIAWPAATVRHLHGRVAASSGHESSRAGATARLRAAEPARHVRPRHPPRGGAALR